MSEISQLQGKIAEADAKLESLEQAKSKVEGIQIRIDSQMPGIDGMHVKGTKYDEQHRKEIEEIESKSSDLKTTYRQAAIDSLAAEIGVVRQLKANLHVQLTAAIAAEEARQAAERSRLLAEAMKRST